MDFSWTEAQTDYRKKVEAFAETLNDEVIARDRDGTFPRELWHACAEFGLQSMSVPAEYNATGTEMDLLTAVLAMEALGYGCRDNGLNLALAAQIWTVQHPIVRFGTDDQKERFLPGMCRGEIIGCHAVTEVDAGSDHLALATLAEPVDGGYRLSGHKRYITLGPIADVALVFATLDPSKGRWGLTAFLVETDSAGCLRGPAEEKMGLRTVPFGTLTFDDCFVPEANRLGPEGAGASISSGALGVERTFILASQVGAMARQLEESVAFAQERRQFGKPIGKFQSISNRLADMRLAVETSRLLLYKVVWMLQNDEKVTLEAALLKLHLAETFVESSLDAIRVHGGGGYVTENGIERDLRDAVGGVLYGGTSDIQRLLIARLLGL